MTMYKNSHWLVETNWLEENINNPNIRIFDCAAAPEPNPNSSDRKKYPVSPKSLKELFVLKHIPNANYLDVPNQLTDKANNVPMMLAAPEQLQTTFRKAGINNSNHVVLYSSSSPIWATRVWCILHSLGFENMSIVNGGLKKWLDEGRPTSSIEKKYCLGNFSIASKKNIFIDKHKVLSAIKNKKNLLIHTLKSSVFDGSDERLIFGRRGHIPNSINLPSSLIIENNSNVFLSSTMLQQLFKNIGADKADNLITYCGGGINASLVAFALALVGYNNISIYDGSMNEWGNDNSLPIEI